MIVSGGMLEMSSAYLPISERWHHYVRQSDDLAQELEEETARALGNQVMGLPFMTGGGGTFKSRHSKQP